MNQFNRNERMLMMLYNPGTRLGLIAELEAMRLQLQPSERRLRKLTDSVTGKLKAMTDEEFDSLEIYPEI